MPKISVKCALEKAQSSLSGVKYKALFYTLFFFLTFHVFLSTVTFNSVIMHRVHVMISTVTQAHTVSEGVGAEQAGWISRRILCMQFKTYKREKSCTCLKYLPSKFAGGVQGAVPSHR